jgi:hypothetical protein
LEEKKFLLMSIVPCSSLLSSLELYSKNKLCKAVVGKYSDAHLKTEAYFQNDFKIHVKKTGRQDLCIGFKGSEYSTVAPGSC